MWPKFNIVRKLFVELHKSELYKKYINSDNEILELQGKISYYESIIRYIDGVIKSIDNRGWDIRNATEWKKFEAGMI